MNSDMYLHIVQLLCGCLRPYSKVHAFNMMQWMNLRVCNWPCWLCTKIPSRHFNCYEVQIACLRALCITWIDWRQLQQLAAYLFDFRVRIHQCLLQNSHHVIQVRWYFNSTNICNRWEVSDNYQPQFFRRFSDLRSSKPCYQHRHH